MSTIVIIIDMPKPSSSRLLFQPLVSPEDAHMTPMQPLAPRLTAHLVSRG